MDEYIKREDALDAVLFALVGTGYQSTAIYAIRDVQTADVVPRAEVDELVHKLECLLCHATGGKLSYHTYPLGTMERAVSDYIQECYDEAKAEVAREIFEEIEKYYCVNKFGEAYVHFDSIEEIKKKYMGEV